MAHNRFVICFVCVGVWSCSMQGKMEATSMATKVRARLASEYFDDLGLVHLNVVILLTWFVDGCRWWGMWRLSWFEAHLWSLCDVNGVR